MPAALALPLLAALAWALFDASRKRLALEVHPLGLTVWLPLAQTPLLLLWALSTPGRADLPAASLPAALASVALNILALFWLMQAMRLSPLGLCIPLLSLTPVGTTLLAWAFRGQVPTLAQGGGILLVLLGALALGLRDGHWRGFGAFLKEPGVRRMTGSALLWSLTAVLDQVALARGAGWGYAAFLSAGVGLLLGGALLARGHGPLLRASLADLSARPLLAPAAAALGALALALQLEALRHAPVGFIETVKRGVGMASAVLLGRLLFREAVRAGQLLAVALMAGGVALVMLR